MSYQERTYHGLQGAAAPRGAPEPMAAGPTERESVTVLRRLAELAKSEGSDFGWGYNGHGTSHTSAVVLADALDLDIETIAFAGSRPDETLADLREDFCAEILTDLCDEWRLNRRAILRWAAVGWYAKHGLTKAPPSRHLS
ncbi:DUF6166 domain-containing protein [Frankia gtarii]|uniref:DUF6166 domain-containing protein n=1 Tax=Frankia gtarii TaxID=2950102 RepID=UPI0021C1D5A5|nr:DUF6166 domain-containing protein [Frankia gtarii]